MHEPPKLGSKSKTSFDDFQEQQPLCAFGVWICCAPSLLHFATLNRCHHPSQETRKPRKIALTLASWNVRTLLGDTKADRPERRTALVAKELARYKVDIAPLSESRFSDRGQLTEISGGYTFRSGRSSEVWHEAGVGFSIRTHHARKLASIR